MTSLSCWDINEYFRILSVELIARKTKTKDEQKQTANSEWVNEHLLWWIQAKLMNNDQCPEAINMFLEGDMESDTKSSKGRTYRWLPSPQKETALTWDRAQHTVEEIHSSHSQMTGNEETRVEKQRKLGDETKIDRDIEAGRGRTEGWNKGKENVPRWQGIRWDV